MRPKGILRKILKHMTWNLAKFKYPNKVNVNLELLGTGYGGWIIPADYLKEDSICYLAGAGEDISFDTSIAEKYGSQVFIFDPTPRAKKHFDLLCEKAARGEVMYVNNTSDKYLITPDKIQNLKFYEIGIWENNGEIKFFAPQNKGEVSHSIVNLQMTDDYFTAQVKTLSTITAELGHKSIDLLKLDIEGAEYKVIESFLKDKIDIKILCIEFDEANNPIDCRYFLRLFKSINNILKAGYSVVYRDNRYDFTFVKNDALLSLSGGK